VLLKVPISNAAFHELLVNQVLFGGPVHILPGFDRLNSFARTLSAYDDAVCFATANMCRALLASSDGESGPLLPGMRALISLGLPLAADEKRALHARVTPNFYEIYGANGFGMISGLRPADLAERAESVGRAAVGARVQIVDAQGHERPVGSVGHLRCQGPTRAEGFALEEDAARGPEAFRDGWYYPGDLAVIDVDGWISLKGRRTDLILRNGTEVYPFEIEAALRRLPGITDAAVIGLPAADGRGEAPIAVIVSERPLREALLSAYCAGVLPPEQRPLGFVAAPAIQKTPGGKVDRPALRAQVESLLQEMAPEGEDAP
jgi:acyl-coenzyme A synthetase/AMP-(fatty) acid ligase